MDNDALIGTSPRNPAFPSQDVLHTLKTTHVPVLHLGADHDIIWLSLPKSPYAL